MLAGSAESGSAGGVREFSPSLRQQPSAPGRVPISCLSYKLRWEAGSLHSFSFFRWSASKISYRFNMQTSPSLRSTDDHSVAPGSRGLLNGSSVEILANDPPFSHRFLDKDPESSKARSLYFRVVIGTVVLVCTYVIWGVLPIYWGSVYDLYGHAHNLHGWVVVSTCAVSSTPLFHSYDRGCIRISTAGRLARQFHKLSSAVPVQPLR